MKAARIHQFGPPDVIVIDDVAQPRPGPGEVLVRVAAAGVGPWDALIREHKSVVRATLPLILGSDLAGVVEEVGPGISAFHVGQEVYGVTNPDFFGAYTQCAIASAKMIARKPLRLSHVEAASAPVVAVTAWQMLFEYAKAKPPQRAPTRANQISSLPTRKPQRLQSIWRQLIQKHHKDPNSPPYKPSINTDQPIKKNTITH